MRQLNNLNMKNDYVNKRNWVLADSDDWHLNPAKLKNNLNDIREIFIDTYLTMNFINQNFPLKKLLNTTEREIIDRALELTNGSQTGASFLLGIKSSTLSEKLKKYNINPIKRKKI